MTVFRKVNFMQGTVDFFKGYLYPPDILIVIPSKSHIDLDLVFLIDRYFRSGEKVFGLENFFCTRPSLQ